MKNPMSMPGVTFTPKQKEMIGKLVRLKKLDEAREKILKDIQAWVAESSGANDGKVRE